MSARDPSRWSTPLDFIRDLGAYDTLRSFKLVFTLGVLMWLPWFKVDRKVRLYSLWFLAVSFLVLIIPLTFHGFSIWRTLIEPLPGFAAIRDPNRIIYLYELAVVFAMGLFLTRLPSQSMLRVSAVLLALVLIATDWNREGFRTSRQILAFDRWVGEPIQVDASCRSFFMKGGPAEVQVALGAHVDALRHRRGLHLAEACDSHAERLQRLVPRRLGSHEPAGAG